FTGQGAQWQGMGQELFEYRIFRESLEAQDSVLQTLSFAPSWSLIGILNGTADVSHSVQDPEISQTVCTALQIALVDLLKSWSITPHVTVGHSSGEIAASYAAGRISFAEAITIAFCRGISVTKNASEGLMLAVGLNENAASTILLEFKNRVQVAAINSPDSVTLSGDRDSIKDIHGRLTSENIFARILETGGIAYHSYHM
ncbi:polyketide synthase, partial [Delitschia confertaspora ATCC 74209]